MKTPIDISFTLLNPKASGLRKKNLYWVIIQIMTSLVISFQYRNDIIIKCNHNNRYIMTHAI